jgi:hypothetical protein
MMGADFKMPSDDRVLENGFVLKQLGTFMPIPVAARSKA